MCISLTLSNKLDIIYVQTIKGHNMIKGFTQLEIKELERRIAIIHGSFDALINQLKDKIDEAEIWVDDRSEKWQESEKGDDFQDWIRELDIKSDELETLKDEINIEFLEEIL